MDPAMIQAAITARKQLVNLFPEQSTVGRFMRAFDSGDNLFSSLIKGWSTIFKGKKYRSGQYLLGEKYMLYVLGIDIHDRKKVPDEMVGEAMDFFSALLSTPITTYEALEELQKDVELYRKNRSEGKDTDLLTLQKAKDLLNKLPFNDIKGAWQSPLQSWAESDTSQAGIMSTVETALGIPPGVGLKGWIMPVVGIVVFLIFIRLLKSKKR
ncbi:hypothetical protein [Paraflavitalea sp. CAU 1676]|uniref:hypothetical protein n=1 Tax=Paraflavitalea sp. CAU 1676 TaxID=3032598 RepID=UPI0023DA6854|nr:hypothetical protein [Paraflavitalea sp. CAU 1676]MDF2188949.1 hypothetical protein [Paraflavitalea sp. CAU 1676]